MEIENKTTSEQEKIEMHSRAVAHQELIQSIQKIQIELADTSVNCTGVLPAFSDVRRGQITSEIIIAKDYYLDPRNQEGNLEERRAKLDKIIEKVFKEFIAKRTNEYDKIRCSYKGNDWNNAGRSSWKTISCQPGFTFVIDSLVRTTNGDWKDGPVWGINNSTLSWKTGGHGHSQTFAEVNAVYFEIGQKVLDELNSARKILHDLGIPTELTY